MKVQVVVRSSIPGADGLPAQFVHRGYDIDVPDDELIEGCEYYVGKADVPPRKTERAATPVIKSPTYSPPQADPDWSWFYPTQRGKSFLGQRPTHAEALSIRPYNPNHRSCGIRPSACLCKCDGCALVMPTHRCMWPECRICERFPR
jgi:hypothetical protein